MQTEELSFQAKLIYPQVVQYVRQHLIQSYLGGTFQNLECLFRAYKILVVDGETLYNKHFLNETQLSMSKPSPNIAFQMYKIKTYN